MTLRESALAHWTSSKQITAGCWGLARDCSKKEAFCLNVWKSSDVDAAVGVGGRVILVVGSWAVRWQCEEPDEAGNDAGEEVEVL